MAAAHAHVDEDVGDDGTHVGGDDGDDDDDGAQGGALVGMQKKGRRRAHALPLPAGRRRRKQQLRRDCAAPRGRRQAPAPAPDGTTAPTPQNPAAPWDRARRGVSGRRVEQRRQWKIKNEKQTRGREGESGRCDANGRTTTQAERSLLVVQSAKELSK